MLWNLHLISKTYQARPSEILHITNSYVAYCLDELVVTFGLHTENNLNKTDKQGKHIHTLESLLQSPEETQKMGIVDFFKSRFPGLSGVHHGSDGPSPR